MILYDVTWINNDNIEYPIADGITIYKALYAIKNDIKEHGFEDNGYYKIYEYNEDDEQEIKRIFKFGRI